MKKHVPFELYETSRADIPMAPPNVIGTGGLPDGYDYEEEVETEEELEDRKKRQTVEEGLALLRSKMAAPDFKRLIDRGAVRLNGVESRRENINRQLEFVNEELVLRRLKTEDQALFESLGMELDEKVWAKVKDTAKAAFRRVMDKAKRWADSESPERKRFSEKVMRAFEALKKEYAKRKEQLNRQIEEYAKQRKISKAEAAKDKRSWIEKLDDWWVEKQNAFEEWDSENLPNFAGGSSSATSADFQRSGGTITFTGAGRKYTKDSVEKGLTVDDQLDEGFIEFMTHGLPRLWQDLVLRLDRSSHESVKSVYNRIVGDKLAQEEVANEIRQKLNITDADLRAAVEKQDTAILSRWEKITLGTFTFAMSAPALCLAILMQGLITKALFFLFGTMTKATVAYLLVYYYNYRSKRESVEGIDDGITEVTKREKELSAEEARLDKALDDARAPGDRDETWCLRNASESDRKIAQRRVDQLYAEQDSKMAGTHLKGRTRQDDRIARLRIGLEYAKRISDVWANLRKKYEDKKSREKGQKKESWEGSYGIH